MRTACGIANVCCYALAIFENALLSCDQNAIQTKYILCYFFVHKKFSSSGVGWRVYDVLHFGAPYPTIENFRFTMKLYRIKKSTLDFSYLANINVFLALQCPVEYLFSFVPHLVMTFTPMTQGHICLFPN